MNQEKEVAIFTRFAEIHHAIRLGSIQPRNPPEPDLVCETTAGETVAFELVEIVDENFARLTSGKLRDAELLDSAYNSAPSDLRAGLADHFGNALIHVTFRDKLSARARKHAAPILLRELGVLSSRLIGEWRPTVGSALRETVISVRVTRGSFSGPVFDVDDHCMIGDPTLAQIKSKWTKRYVADHPIELLAYYGQQPVLPELFWLEQLDAFVERNVVRSPFRRVWLFDSWARIIRFSAPRQRLVGAEPNKGLNPAADGSTTAAG